MSEPAPAPTGPPPPEVVVRLAGPADLLGMLPHRLGFHPGESLVVVCLHGPRRRDGLVMRFDLPPRGAEPVLAREVAVRAAHAGADEVLLVCYTDSPSDATAGEPGASGGRGVAGDPPAAAGRLPRRRLVSATVRALARRGTPTRDALLVHRGRFYSYLCAEPRCCPPDGVPLPDRPTDGALRYAAETALRGRTTLPSRDALAASVAAVAGGPRRRELRVLHAGVRRELARRLAAGQRGACRAETLALLDQVCRGWQAAPDGPPRLPDEQAVRLVVGLHDVHARDQVVTWSLRPGSEVLAAVLGELTRAALPPYAAPVCTVLAWVAYTHGDGALAAVALERARAEDPGYSLAHLVGELLHAQAPPEVVRRITSEVARELRTDRPR